jgi:hypothetical protein
MREIVPPVLGVLTVGGATLGIRAFVRPDTEPMQMVYRYAPWLGLGIGALAAGVSWMLGGLNPATSTVVAGALTAGVVAGNDMLNVSRPGAIPALAASTAVPAVPAAAGLPGLRALVAERQGMRGIVMEPIRGGMKGAYGDTVNLQGAANPSAFGRPQSRIG